MSPMRPSAFAGYSRIVGLSVVIVTGPLSAAGLAPATAAAATPVVGSPATAIEDRPLRRNSLRLMFIVRIPSLCPTALRHDTAVHGDAFSGQTRCAIAGEERDHPGQFCGVA